MFFCHRFGTAFAALIGDPGVVKHAIEAGAKVFIATVATFTASRLAVKRPFLSAFVAVPCHGVFILRLLGQALGIRWPLGQALGLFFGLGVGEVGDAAFEEFGGEADRFVQGGVGVDG